MPAPRLLTVGEAFEDLVFVGLERLPNPGEEVKTNTFHATFGGGAVITAVGTARLGIATSILSALSAPAAARLRRERVRVTNLRRAGEPHAITAALSTASDRSFVTFNGVNAVLEPRLLRALASTTATHVHFALGPGRPAAWARMAVRLRRRGTPCRATSAGTNRSPPTTAWRRIDALDLVFLNELEAPLYSHATSLDDAYGRLRTARSNVVVKLGAQGSRWLRADGDVVMPSRAVKAVDSTGAGDAFNAGFLAAWLAGRRRPPVWRPATVSGAPRRARPAGSTACRRCTLPRRLRPDGAAPTRSTTAAPTRAVPRGVRTRARSRRPS